MEDGCSILVLVLVLVFFFAGIAFMSHLSGVGGHGGVLFFSFRGFAGFGAENWVYYIDKFEHLHENKTEDFNTPLQDSIHTPSARRMSPARPPAGGGGRTLFPGAGENCPFGSVFGGVKRYLNAKTPQRGISLHHLAPTLSQVVMGEFEDTIARTVIAAFSELPPKSKPKKRPGCAEWVPLAGIALETGGGEMICVALAWVSFFLPRGRRGGTKLIGLQDWDEVSAARKDTSCCGDGAA